VSSAQAAAGLIEYRCVYVHNSNATLTYLGSKVFIQTNTPSADTTVAIGLGTSGLNSTEVRRAKMLCFTEGIGRLFDKPIFRYQAHNEDFSKILWPVKWNEKKFREIRSMFVAQGNPEGYYQEYLNRPIDPFNTFFKKSDFIDFDENDYTRPWEYAPTYLSLDGAFSTKERRDWCALGVASLDETGMLYIRQVIRERMDTKEVVDTIVRLQERYKFTVVLMGKGAYEKGIGPFLQDEIRRHNKFLHIEALPETIDKRLRATSIRGRMRVGGVKFAKKMHWYPDFEQELLEFDRGKHDDQVDMMSLFGMYLDKLMTAPTQRQIQDIEYDDEFKDSLNWDLGRSEIAGY